MSISKFDCIKCAKSYSTYKGLASHASRSHGCTKEELRIHYFHKGVRPVCACGCGQFTKWHSSGFMTYLNGHNAVHNNPMLGRSHSKEAKESISVKRKEKFAGGEYRIWQNENTEETRNRLEAIAEHNKTDTVRAKKISDRLTGVPKSEEHKRKSRIGITKAWENPELREQQAQNRLALIQKNGWYIKSKLETTFATILDELAIEYKRQYFVKDIRAFYDFHLPKYNTLIEVHGDFWHCNPATKHTIPKYDSQHKNLINDIKKSRWADLNDIKLLVFWECDIHQNTEEIRNRLASLSK